MVESKKSKFISDGTTYVLLIIGGIIMLVPFIWMILTSFKTLEETFSLNVTLLPKHFILDNYKQVWSLLPFGRFFINSFVVSFCVTIGQIILCSLSAYAFARLEFPGRDKLFLLYLAALMIPSQVMLVPSFIIVKYLHLTDNLAGVIIPQLFSVFGTFLLRQFFLSIPKEIEEAARIDGCGFFGTYLRIILPMSKSALTILGLFAFMSSWNSFLWPLIVLNKESNYTVPIGLVTFQGQFTTNWPIMMAAACQSMIPVIIVYIFAQKYLIEGISLTGFGGR
ncbi:carbohydrate ABC transporter permease [Clostridium pasteurianum]|uniref:ABC-type sugar transport system, permease component n=1 Tax=Clostridium pasteurianum BC1 TaxID=86416 RepID=R4K5P8_CLOPA|nr:carbohydrate ABC transporter permease [Clostridium pasteurianum]AGK98482.1 ABC-type sugar transport system, permease component [Clostridium pasteurianum BC1]